MTAMAHYDARQAREQVRAATRRALIDAARAILNEDGLSGLTVRSVGERVNASAKLIYTLFGGKDGLLEAVYLDAFAGLEAMLDGGVDTLTPRERVTAMADAYRRYALAHPDRYAVMFGDAVAGFTPSEDARRRAWRTFAALRQAIRDSNDRLDDQQTDLATRVLWAAMHGAISLELRALSGSPALADAIFDGAVSAATARYLSD
jgi:AcrR family transcriptional regulator